NPVVGASQYEALAAQAGDSVIPHWPAENGQVKLSAAWLIERAGFGKGFRSADDQDGARISTKHALALTNPGEGSTASLIWMARQIKAGVCGSFGVDLTIEPVLVGVTL